MPVNRREFVRRAGVSALAATGLSSTLAGVACRAGDGGAEPAATAGVTAAAAAQKAADYILGRTWEE